MASGTGTGTDKVNPPPSTSTGSSSATPEAARRAEINLQPETSATDAPTTPQDAGGDPISETAEEQVSPLCWNLISDGREKLQIKAAGAISRAAQLSDV